MEHDPESGKKKRVRQDTIPGYFPEIIDREDFARVQELLSDRNPLRGRHAGGPLRNLFGGILRCDSCGASVSLVNKGQGRGHGRYLVCAAAKTGAGCRYHSLPYDQAEGLFLNAVPSLLGEVPAGDAEGHTAELLGIDEHLPEAEFRLRTLTDELADERNPAVRSQLRGRMAELAEEAQGLRDRREELQRLQAAARGSVVERKVEDLWDALQADPLDRKRANGLLRQVFSGITLDRSGGLLNFEWRHGGESSVLVAWPEEGSGEAAQPPK